MQKIIEHEDWQGLSFEDFVFNHASRYSIGKLPPVANAQGRVFARINEGRWIADCPQQGCGGALCVSSRLPYFFCPYCGNAANGGQWYHLIFPPEKAAIETILLNRPARDPWVARNRNWIPGETIADLKRENTERGIK